jgi:O-antigen ligase
VPHGRPSLRRTSRNFADVPRHQNGDWVLLMAVFKCDPNSAPLLPSALLAATFFLLSADLLFVLVAGHKVKYGYFLILAMWLLAPRAMLATVRAAVRRIPHYAWLPVLPLAVSVATSVNPRDSIAWSLWLAFDLFTVATIYAYVKALSFSAEAIRTSLTVSLTAIMLFALLQFVAIYGFGQLLFSPQLHFDVYRINGVSGWPHFLNIYAFLLLPIVLVQRILRWPVMIMVAMLVFVLVQSTAKTGWVLFVALGCLLLLLDRRLFLKRWGLFLLPVTLVALMIPTPTFMRDVPAVSGSEKVSKFSADLDITNETTSGTDRMLISAMGLRVWSKHPWFGVGPRAYDEYVLTRFDLELPGESKFGANRMVITKSENIWVEFLAENGALFTLAFAFVLVRALWVPRWKFADRLHLGAWIALILYFAISGQFSQSGLLTMAYAVLGICFHARERMPQDGEPGQPPAVPSMQRPQIRPPC